MRNVLLAVTSLMWLSACAGTVNPDGAMEETATVAVAPEQALWQALLDARLVGPEAWQVRSHPGLTPHGPLLQQLEGRLTVNGRTGPVIVQRQYGGAGASKDGIAAYPARYLQTIAVMMRMPGHDPGHGDWFWARYRPDGSPEHIDAAHCIACHRTAPGGDWVFSHDRFAR